MDAKAWPGQSVRLDTPLHRFGNFFLDGPHGLIDSANDGNAAIRHRQYGSAESVFVEPLRFGYFLVGQDHDGYRPGFTLHDQMRYEVAPEVTGSGVGDQEAEVVVEPGPDLAYHFTYDRGVRPDARSNQRKRLMVDVCNEFLRRQRPRRIGQVETQCP